MNISFYSSRTAMIAQQQGLNVYSNNIANINTVGYKPLRPSFSDCIYTLQHPNREQWQTGHGQYLSKTDFMWSQSNFIFTEQPLDFALPNDYFFMTMDQNNEFTLTRDGAFQVHHAGATFAVVNDVEIREDIWILTDALGNPVLGPNRNQIQIPFVLDGDGQVTTEIDYEALYAMIGIFAVPNNWGLDQASNNRFNITDRSGDAVSVHNSKILPIPEDENGQAIETADLLSGALEMSATDLASEMVRIIETQRSYQLNARILKVSDEFQTTVNNLR